MRAAVDVDVLNPGQVFACLGLQEIAEALGGAAESRFVVDPEGEVRFELRWGAAAGFPSGDARRADAAPADDPVTVALEFLRRCVVERWPDTSVFPRPDKDPKRWPMRLVGRCAAAPGDPSRLRWAEAGARQDDEALARIEVPLSCWADGSGRGDFKLFAGPQVGPDILGKLMEGDAAKEEPGVRDLLWRWAAGPRPGPGAPWPPLRPSARLPGGEAFYDGLFGGVVRCSSSFRIDPRGSWTAIGIGYSLDKIKSAVANTSNPLVEVLAVAGLEHARPCRLEGRRFRYALWGAWSSTSLARAWLGAPSQHEALATYGFRLEGSGKYKNVTFAVEL